MAFSGILPRLYVRSSFAYCIGVTHAFQKFGHVPIFGALLRYTHSAFSDTNQSTVDIPSDASFILFCRECLNGNYDILNVIKSNGDDANRRLLPSLSWSKLQNSLM